MLETAATSNYHSLQAVYEHRFANGLALNANYTYGKCMSDDNGKGALSSSNRGGTWVPGWGVAHEYALCPGDATHVFHVYGEYALPFGKGERFMAHANRLANAVFGGWQINYIFTYQSGFPVNIGCPKGTTGNLGCYALKVPGQNPYAGPHDHTQWLNPAAFNQPCQLGPSGVIPNSPAGCVPLTGLGLLGGQANQVRAPGWSDLDASIFKNFSMTEHAKLQIRLEAFNAINAVEFGGPGQLNFTTSNFSNITGLRVGARVVQIAGKILF